MIRPLAAGFAITALALASSPVRAAAPSSPDAVTVAGVWTPETIPWQAAAPKGTKYALLEGNRDTPGGVFTYAFFVPARVWDSPHWHSTTARVFVLKGALSLGYGTEMDKTRARTFAAGSLVIVPGGAAHFDGADVDTIIVGVATGPWSTTYVDGSKPASAGTPVRR